MNSKRRIVLSICFGENVLSSLYEPDEYAISSKLTAAGRSDRSVVVTEAELDEALTELVKRKLT